MNTLDSYNVTPTVQPGKLQLFDSQQNNTTVLYVLYWLVIAASCHFNIANMPFPSPCRR
ncbi:hypothetical protein EJ05DRAFT_480378 [Pseudovirgaria hyperparasitica]|uniref:Uncharacterized protein n=1 Tax=Pseudovirgaria hyperparasitica TaxID=470096 RepID=A0A6A6VVU3_9PEZI|nr:uncharacterized protein EJ05DRAFT_480378 [Pseudovirgaria hyperparasitica]KAF2753361.1 hypothetical protein EJ05DRAFT_480378 [Pseudovirgaria hyperparasitica]